LWEFDPADRKSLHITATSELRSDFNGNGVVDTADYILWRKRAGQPAGGSPADGTGPGGMPDGVVNEWDYDLWRANFGTRIVSSSQGSFPQVPEPNTALILGLSISIGGLARFRRR
jgi:hypothetical protein